jgi:chloramphenicol O-acetyltransferase
MSHNNTKTLKQTIDEINLKYYEEYRHYHNASKRIIDYSPSLDSYFGLVLTKKQYAYKKLAQNYIKKHKITNYLLVEEKYSNSTKVYRILEVF